MGLDGIMKMVDDYDLNKRTALTCRASCGAGRRRASSRRASTRANPGGATSIRLRSSASAEFVTPIAMLRAVAGIAVDGKFYVPHLLKEAKAVDAIGPFDSIPPHSFDRPDPKIVPLNPENQRLVIDGMYDVVHVPGGTGYRIRLEGFDIAGKTGTAQVVSLGKDVGENKDHAWFVSFAPAHKPEIAAIALIENVGFGGTHAAPAVRAVYDAFYTKTRGTPPPRFAQEQCQRLDVRVSKKLP